MSASFSKTRYQPEKQYYPTDRWLKRRCQRPSYLRNRLVTNPIVASSPSNPPKLHVPEHLSRERFLLPRHTRDLIHPERRTRAPAHPTGSSNFIRRFHKVRVLDRSHREGYRTAVNLNSWKRTHNKVLPRKDHLAHSSDTLPRRPHTRHGSRPLSTSTSSAVAASTPVSSTSSSGSRARPRRPSCPTITDWQRSFFGGELEVSGRLNKRTVKLGARRTRRNDRVTGKVGSLLSIGGL